MCKTPPHQQTGGMHRRLAIARYICAEHARALYPNLFQTQAGRGTPLPPASCRDGASHPSRLLLALRPASLAVLHTHAVRRSARARGGSAAHMKQAPAMNTGMAVWRLRSWYFLLLQATTCGAPLPPQRAWRAARDPRVQHRRGARATAAPRRGWPQESGTRARPGHRRAHASLRQPPAQEPAA